jgi:hypothetical protein
MDKLTSSIGLYAQAGIDYDMNINQSSLIASGLTGLNAVAMNTNAIRLRPNATFGAYYDVSTNQRLSLEAATQKQVFQSTSLRSALLTYTLGF